MSSQMVSCMTGTATEIQVIRRSRNGWHIYTCEALPGLYVASKDDKKAYYDLPNAIRMLYKLDYGATVSVFHKADYDSFMKQLELGTRAAESIEERTREMMDSRRTVLSFMIGSTNNDFASSCH